MSLQKILDKALNTNITVTRQVATINSIGEKVTSSTTTPYTALSACIQQLNDLVTFEREGVMQTQTHAGYLNKYVGSTATVILPDDNVLDNETSTNYRVLGIKTLLASNRSISTSHHLKLLLEKVS